MLILLLLVAPAVAAECIDLYSGIVLNSTTTLCSGNYSIDSGIVIANNKTVVECNNTFIRCKNPLSMGFVVSDVKNIAIRNCVVSGCQNGFYLKDVRDSFFIGNFLVGNNIGIANENSYGNVFDNMFSGNNEDFVNITVPVVKKFSEPEKFNISIVISDDEARDILFEDYGNETDSVIKKYLEKSTENINIVRIIEVGNGSTVVSLEITPKKELFNVSIYEDIPKCFAVYVDEIISDTRFKVLREDPLIVWRFNKIGKKKVLSYKVNKEVSSDCIRLLKALGISVGSEEPKFVKPKKGFSKSVMAFVIVVFASVVMGYMLNRKKI